MADSTAAPRTAGIFGPVAAEAYERSMGRWSRRLAPLLLDFAGAGGARRILDVGCGTGSLTFAAAERYPDAKVTGCDIAEPLLAHARAVNPAPERILIEHGDACDLPYGDGTFDLTLSSLVLMFVPDGGQAAREMARVTRAGGIVVAATWDFRGGMPQMRMLMDTAAALDEGAAALRVRIMSGPGVRPSHLAALWGEAGLVAVRETTLSIRMEFADFEDCWAPSTGGGVFGPVYRAMSSERQDLLREKVRAAYLAGDPDGPRSFTATAWAVAGEVGSR
jgi:SAM-dependent methyltransferase